MADILNHRHAHVRALHPQPHALVQRGVAIFGDGRWRSRTLEDRFELQRNRFAVDGFGNGQTNALAIAQLERRPPLRQRRQRHAQHHQRLLRADVDGMVDDSDPG
jgi:hypothetical protein